MLKFDKAKDPGDLMDYEVDCSGVIPSGDEISGVTWTVPVGLTKVTQSHSGRSAKVWLDGGTDGRTYQIHMRAVTAAGRVADADVLLEVAER